jgi:hypothetical protein
VIRVELPAPLRLLAHVGPEIRVEHTDPTIGGVLDSIEQEYPMLRGTIRDQRTGVRRPFIRFFAGGCDLSHDPMSARLPEGVLSNAEPLLIVGAMAGG